MYQCPNCNRTDFGSRSGFTLHIRSCKAVPPTPPVPASIPGIDSPPASGFPDGHLALCQWAIAHALTAMREGDMRTARRALEEAAGLAGMMPIKDYERFNDPDDERKARLNAEQESKDKRKT